MFHVPQVIILPPKETVHQFLVRWDSTIMYHLCYYEKLDSIINSVYVATCLCLTLAPLLEWLPHDATMMYRLVGKKLCTTNCL